jgi:hypothetical protein
MPVRLAKAAIAFVLITSVAPALGAEPQRAFTLYELEALGATEMADGKLFQDSVVTCLPLQGAGRGCGEPQITYGTFRRLRLDGAEFVCVSFRAWQCYESK